MPNSTRPTATWSTASAHVEAPRSDVLAAGVLPWRVTGAGLEVMLIHRPRYDDWSWPKGKLDPGETLPECAIRELGEEVGLSLHLGVPLAVTRYEVPRRSGGTASKEVWYWAAEAGRARAEADGDEVDEILWTDPATARQRLTNDTDRGPLDELVRAHEQDRLRTVPFIVLRHAKAKPRSSWSRAEGERPLAATGRRQALAVSSLLGVWRLEKVLSSPWRRCMETVAPFVKASRLPLKTKPAFTEAGASAKPKRARRQLASLLDKRRGQVLCSHRPVLPLLLEGVAGRADRNARDEILRALPTADPYLSPGAVVVAQQALGHEGAVVSVEVYDPWQD